MESYLLSGKFDVHFDSPALYADYTKKADELQERIREMVAKATDVHGDPLARRMRELASTALGKDRSLELHARANELDDTDPLISPIIRLAQRERARRLWLDLTGEEVGL